MNIVERLSRDKSKTYYTIEWGRGPGEKESTGIYTFVKLTAHVQKKRHNKESFILFERRNSEFV